MAHSSFGSIQFNPIQKFADLPDLTREDFGSDMNMRFVGSDKPDLTQTQTQPFCLVYSEHSKLSPCLMKLSLPSKWRFIILFGQEKFSSCFEGKTPYRGTNDKPMSTKCWERNTPPRVAPATLGDCRTHSIGRLQPLPCSTQQYRPFWRQLIVLIF